MSQIFNMHISILQMQEQIRLLREENQKKESLIQQLSGYSLFISLLNENFLIIYNQIMNGNTIPVRNIRVKITARKNEPIDN